MQAHVLLSTVSMLEVCDSRGVTRVLRPSLPGILSAKQSWSLSSRIPSAQVTSDAPTHAGAWFQGQAIDVETLTS